MANAYGMAPDNRRSFMTFIHYDKTRKRFLFSFTFDNYFGSPVPFRQGTRAIIPRNDRDFLRFLYEFIYYFKIDVKNIVAEDETVAERVGAVIEKYEDELEIKIDWPWKEEGLFLKTKEQMQRTKELLARYTYTLKDIVRKLEEEENIFKTERAVRHYENIGLLAKPRIIEKKKRYDYETYRKIVRIIKLQEEGKKLEAIRKIMAEAEE